MILYTTPGACSTATHIALEASGLDYSTVLVDLRAKRLESGLDYLTVNPKGAVPALRVDEDEVLTENMTCLVYIADKSGSAALLPLSGLERYRVLEWTNYVTTELHKGFGPLFNPAASDELKDATKALIAKKFDYVEAALGGAGPFLTGAHARICDYYLYVILRWTDQFGIDLVRWPALAEFRRRVAAEEPVARVLERTGLGA
ncbi:glutathione transferase GstA [Sphingomonas ginkgonis]|uniref:Glutathione transferase GstA n=1 Tax=Sphingomonas ginkgonis TaxID=2315330 RepID=A0A3R9YP58_9SPHN|nr:glutathione transferase GstA [Sphingomonas ginkgonis]